MRLLQLLEKKHWRLLICLIGFAINFTAYYSGFLTNDSFNQYRQALANNYGDWHPPIMAVVWHMLNKIHTGSSIMAAFQLTLLWSSCYIAMDIMANKWWRIMILIFTLSPLLQNFSGYLIKDTQMGFSWLLAFVIMCRAALHNRKLTIAEGILTFILLQYGTMVRINALPGAIPLYMQYGWMLAKGKRRQIKVLFAAGAFIFGLGIQQVINKVLIKPYKEYAATLFYMQDLTNIFVATGDNVYPSILYKNPEFDTAYIRAHYIPVTIDNIWWNNDNINIINKPINEPTAIAMHQAWSNAIKTHPFVYLKARTIGFLYYLRIINRGSPLYNSFTEVQDNDLGLSFKPNIFSKIFFKWLYLNHDMPYMKPWFWFFFNFLLIFITRRIKNEQYRFHYRILIYSSLLYMLPSFFIHATDTDFRYMYWNCIACGLATCLFIADRREQRALKIKQQAD